MKIVFLNHLPEVGISHNPEIKKRVMLNSEDIPYLTTLSQARFTAGQVADAHSHDKMYEVFLIVTGEGLIRVDSKDHPLYPGVCLMVEPGEVHEIVNTGTQDLVMTYFGIISPGFDEK
jgi:mannose-6-phosphate isomerase-like protein (cupin superfamily)